MEHFLCTNSKKFEKNAIFTQFLSKIWHFWAKFVNFRPNGQNSDCPTPHIIISDLCRVTLAWLFACTKKCHLHYFLKTFHPCGWPSNKHEDWIHCALMKGKKNPTSIHLSIWRPPIPSHRPIFAPTKDIIVLKSYLVIGLKKCELEQVQKLRMRKE